ncbi:hypothetical protein LZ32DRAFT_149065 [Colletotrichum eremochloae]|nr:hypothetical protein LZ32DRAFT_149065 [Colletotrichum eremochloae]
MSTLPCLRGCRKPAARTKRVSRCLMRKKPANGKEKGSSCLRVYVCTCCVHVWKVGRRTVREVPDSLCYLFLGGGEGVGSLPSSRPSPQSNSKEGTSRRAAHTGTGQVLLSHTLSEHFLKSHANTNFLLLRSASTSLLPFHHLSLFLVPSSLPLPKILPSPSLPFPSCEDKRHSDTRARQSRPRSLFSFCLLVATASSASVLLFYLFLLCTSLCSAPLLKLACREPLPSPPPSIRRLFES